ncbi:MAG: Nramp family divalent metal transporter, partial [Actinomycetota bacterium]|nr:Nramp family divalent metal transporter [Actinomycetota bacterium]
NLTQSNYVRDKGLAMGQRMPKVVSPITGEEEARASLGYTFPTTEENMRRWRGWWKVANQEQILVFYIIGVLTLIGLSVLTFTALGRETGVEGDFTFLQRVAAGLGDRIGTWFQYFYLIAGTVILFSTSLGVMDYVARLTASELKVSYFRRSERVTESRIYFAAAWLIAILGSLILLAGFQQPLVLLIISASGGGVVMALYSVMLIVLNTRALPQPIRLKGWRLYVMAVTAVFFLFFSVLLVYDVFMTNLLGG